MIWKVLKTHHDFVMKQADNKQDLNMIQGWELISGGSLVHKNLVS